MFWFQKIWDQNRKHFFFKMALQDIIQKILNDAEKEAQELLESARTEANTIVSQAKENAKEASSQIIKNGDEKIDHIHKKIANLGRHQRKANILRVKRDVLATAFNKAKEKISALPPVEKEAIICAMIRSINSSEGIIHPTQGDEEIVEAGLKKSKKPFDIAESISGNGGFLLVTPTSEIDFRFDTLVDRELSKQMESEISALLFAG